MAQKVPFQKVMDSLLDESTPFPASYLKEFSDLTPAHLETVMQAWPDIPEKRKRTFLEDLEDLAMADTLTNFEDLARPLLTDPDPYVRIQAIRLLWESEDKKLIPVFLKLLEDEEHPEVRAAAAGALGLFVYLGELEKVPPQLHRQVEDRLMEVVNSKAETPIRRRALESLGYSGREEVIPLIENAYRNKDQDWVVTALFAMGRSSDERWKKQVLSQLLASSPEIRSEAITAAGELELTSARGTLMDLLDDEEDLEVRRNLVWALSKIGGEGVREKLDELMEMEDDEEEADFLEEALENLSFTEDSQFELFGLDWEDGSHEEDEGEEK
jgi:HEAT repeat protein